MVALGLWRVESSLPSSMITENEQETPRSSQAPIGQLPASSLDLSVKGAFIRRPGRHLLVLIIELVAH